MYQINTIFVCFLWEDIIMSSEVCSLINWGFILIPQSEKRGKKIKHGKIFESVIKLLWKKIKASFPVKVSNDKTLASLFSFKTNDQSLLYLTIHGEINTYFESAHWSLPGLVASGTKSCDEAGGKWYK